MKPVNGISYVQIEFEIFKSEFISLVDALKNAKSFDAVVSKIDAINAKRNRWESMSSIAEANHFSDLSNPSYEKAVAHYEDRNSEIMLLIKSYYDAISHSAFSHQIEEKYGSQLLEIAKNESELTNENVKELLAEESKLSKEFGNVFHQIKYKIAGNSYSPDSIKVKLKSSDREERQKAVSAQSSKFNELEESLSNNIISLIKVRNKIARACGFDNYTSYSFTKLGRYDYSVCDIENHRKHLHKHLVPLTTSIRKEQAKKVKISNLKFHDYEHSNQNGDLFFEFESKENIEKISKMFHEISTEAGHLFDKMNSKGLIDHKMSENRMPGNFAFYIPQKKTAYLHTNFTGSKEDFQLFSHEFGHALAYTLSDTEIPEYVYPFIEGAETQSTAMEYFCWPWMEQFFGDRANEYKKWHLSASLLYLPQLSLIDEFEQALYEKEPQNADALLELWKETELKYIPFIEYEKAPFYSKGGRCLAFANWFVDYPCWSICYSLAQINAFQLWMEFKKDRKAGWDKYLLFCKIGGRSSVLDTLKKCGIESPLKDTTIVSVINNIAIELAALGDEAS